MIPRAAKFSSFVEGIFVYDGRVVTSWVAQSSWDLHKKGEQDERRAYGSGQKAPHQDRITRLLSEYYDGIRVERPTKESIEEKIGPCIPRDSEAESKRRLRRRNQWILVLLPNAVVLEVAAWILLRRKFKWRPSRQIRKLFQHGVTTETAHQLVPDDPRAGLGASSNKSRTSDESDICDGPIPSRMKLVVAEYSYKSAIGWKTE
ncbi:hypothetical protein B0H12DRAFT_1067818 [Mycena haematopus]|nr:hypothetical protein B0H12DRAFT_1067818 [Mycena haematopus]